MEESGGQFKFFLYIYSRKKVNVATTKLMGEYECKVDKKGRIIFPSALKKQFAPELQEKFVINRGFEDCLVIRSMDVWDKIISKVNDADEFTEKDREFTRNFHYGATTVVLDSQNRFLVPKILIPHAFIDTEVILYAYGNKTELWDRSTFRKKMAEDQKRYSKVSQEVMGKQAKKETTQDVP